MTPEQHARAKEIFLAACALPVNARTGYLDQACGADDALRSHIEDLLSHHVGAPPTRDDGTTATHASAAAGESPAADLPERKFAPGTLLGGRYRIVSLLGKGGMGEVYRADDLLLGQPVALKFLPDIFRRNPAALERLVREARTARRVTHPNLCRVHDFSIETGEAFISMEYVEGEDLRSLLRRIGRIPPERAIEFARQLCVALAAVHARGVLHRDLKPANIMIDSEGRVRVMDFGLASIRSQIAEHEIGSGTPGYMAPELFAGTDVSVRSDVYSLGLILFEMLVGQPVFQADDYWGFARQHLTAHPRRAHELIPELAPSLDDLIQRCLAKNPADRPASALEVAAALPGGDPLAVAIAAGVTPPPMIVAGAADRRTISRPIASAVFAASALLVGIVGWLAAPSGLAPGLRDAKPPTVLVERAREIAQRLGFVEAAREASSFTYRSSSEFLGRSEVAHFSDEFGLASADLDTPSFWYRRSPASLAPTNALNITFGRGRTSLVDPPRRDPGTLTLVLDKQGKLLGMEATPAPARFSAATAPIADWGALFREAGLDLESFTIVDAKLSPRAAPLVTHAWERAAPVAPGANLRVEAAEIGGRPVLFAVMHKSRPVPELPQSFDDTWRTAVTTSTRVTLLLVVALGAIPLAILHIRRGRGDRSGTLRLSIFVFAARLTVWGLAASHTDVIDVEMVLLLFAVLGASAEAALAGLFYLALEPYVRRFWPEAVISWSRILGGRLRDSRVARDVLIGVLLGAVFSLLFVLDRYLPTWLGLETRPPLRLNDALESMLGPRFALAAIGHVILGSTYTSLVLLVLLVFARALVRRTWPAAMLTALVMAPIYIPIMTHPLASLLPLGIILVLAFWAVIRFGLVAIICATFVSRLLLSIPVEFRPGTWGWEGSILVFAVLIAIAVFGLVFSVRPSTPVQLAQH